MKFFYLTLIALFSTMLYADEVIEKTYEDIKSINVHTVSGDCVVKSHNKDTVELKAIYREKSDIYEITMDVIQSELKIREKYKGRGNNIDQRLKLELIVPENTKLDFGSASGEFYAYGFNGKIEAQSASGDLTVYDNQSKTELETASGDITIKDIQAKIEISAASGDVEVISCKGELEITNASGRISVKDFEGKLETSNASGTIKVEDCKLSENCEFSNASGDIDLENCDLSDYCEVSSATGDIDIVMSENTRGDNFEFSTYSGDVTIRLKDGRLSGEVNTRKNNSVYISSDIQITKEIITDSEKQITFGSGESDVTINVSTHSGVISIKN